MHVLILDGHPDEGRLVGALLDYYARSLPPGVTVQRIAVRDLAFDPNLRRGYGADQDWEPDLRGVGAAIGASGVTHEILCRSCMEFLSYPTRSLSM